MERRVCRGGDVIELFRRIVLRAPGQAGVRRDGAAAVVPVDEVRRIVGIDPEGVMIAVRSAECRGRLSAVLGPEERRVLHVHDVLVRGVGVHMGVIESALANGAVRVHERPCRARVVGAEQPSVLVLDKRVDAIGVRVAHGDADTSDHAGRHPGVACDLGPALTAIDGLEDAVPGATEAAAFDEALLLLPERRVDRCRIARIDPHVVGARVLVLV